MPKLTVIIPVRNEEKRLPRCLQSILAQSFTDWEVICIDDGSSDGTFPTPGDLPDLGIEPTSPAFVGGFFTTVKQCCDEHWGTG